MFQAVEKGKRHKKNAEDLGLGPSSWLWHGLVSAASICGWAFIHWGGYLTRLCRSLSVTLNFLDPGWPISSTYSRLVTVKLMVKGTGAGPAAAGGEKGYEKHIIWILSYFLFLNLTWGIQMYLLSLRRGFFKRGQFPPREDSNISFTW